MFEDEKIDFIESLPEADAILVVWIKLLTMAGRCNANGFIFLTEQIPYTAEMLAHRFRRPLNTVKLALKTLLDLGMIEFGDNDFLKVTNWEKHQNIEGMEKIREQNRIRKQRQRERERQKLLEISHVTSHESHATDIDKELEEDIDIDKDIKSSTTTSTLTQNDINLIISEWNKLGLQNLRSINKSTNRYKMLKARIQEYSLEDVIQAIRSINNSDFLKGQNQRGWTITFDWLIKPNNFIKVLEGNYLNKEGGDNGNSGKGNIEEHNQYDNPDIGFSL